MLEERVSKDDPGRRMMGEEVGGSHQSSISGEGGGFNHQSLRRNSASSQGSFHQTSFRQTSFRK